MANIVELRNMNNEELNELLEDVRTEMFNLRFQKAAGSLENTARLKQVRREIAQISEVLSKREWAIEEVATHPEIVSALKDAEWTGDARYVYESGVWQVTITDADGGELANAQVDLNKKRRRTRRHRSNIAPVQKVVGFEVAS